MKDIVRVFARVTPEQKAQIIVTDDNFESIVSGIEEGRYAYSNVRKVTLLLISTG